MAELSRRWYYTTYNNTWWIGVLSAAIVISFLSILIRCVILPRMRQNRAVPYNSYETAYIGQQTSYPRQAAGPYPQQGSNPYPTFEMSQVAEGQGVWNDKMEPEAEKRRAEEADLTSGRRVCAQDYTYNVSECTIEQERVYARELQQESTSYDQQYYVCMIGWTKHTQQQIDEIVATLHPQYGSQTLPANNAHQFFSGLAGRIVDKKALDWGWFSDNVRYPVTSQQTLVRVPPGLVQRNLGETGRPIAHPQEAHVHGQTSPYAHPNGSPNQSTALLASTDDADKTKDAPTVTVTSYNAGQRYA
ncbi:hypothetical protein MRB53_038821 [Persea americana]|nr:hypothetical protein MRB53_038821 [Persea americana]